MDREELNEVSHAILKTAGFVAGILLIAGVGAGLLFLRRAGPRSSLAPPATPTASRGYLPYILSAEAAEPARGDNRATPGLQPTVVSTPAVQATGPVVGTAVAGTAFVSPSTPAPTDTPTATPEGFVIVSRTDNGRTISLTVGQRFILDLGLPGYDWTVVIEDPSLVSRIADRPGTQGVYEARRTGRTLLTASGDPPCRKATPPCMAPSFGFRAEIHVAAAPGGTR
jgi:hypothetical protein